LIKCEIHLMNIGFIFDTFDIFYIIDSLIRLTRITY